MRRYVGALDQGTTSTRFMVFDHADSVVAVDQREHGQIYPKPGWVEHDPLEIDDLRANWASAREWQPTMDPVRREKEYRLWKKAVTKTFDWID
jgi:glycerol kinase